MERNPDTPPSSLAQLIARRGQPVRPKRVPAVPPADALGQFGLLFTEPESGETDGTEPESLPHRSPVPSPAARKLWSVAELVSTLRGGLERDYADVWVEGELSNVRPSSSGALYFTLRDGDAQLSAVLFRRAAGLLRWRPADGTALLARGRISVFEPRGQLQLIAETIEPRGAGALQLQFEQLKARLLAEGLFDAARKRPLPAYPATIGVVTGTQGAVIRDIVTVARRRHGCLHILVYPALVQGTGAAAEILAGVRYFNSPAAPRVDVIVVARGGGSTEDLWAFNDEALARGIAASAIPVVSAVGHETDFTVADFVADLRAPTPSAAAELLTEAQHRAGERIDTLRARLLRGVRWQTLSARQRFQRVAATALLRRVPEALDRRTQRVDALQHRLDRAIAAALHGQRNRLQSASARLTRQDARERIAASRNHLAGTAARLQRLAPSLTSLRHNRLDRAAARLAALSPTAVLQRGYALAFTADGTLLRSTAQATPGTVAAVRLADGTLFTRIESIASTATGAQPRSPEEPA